MAADDSTGMEGRLYTFGSLKSGEGLYCQSTFCVLKGRFFAQYRDEQDEIPLREGVLDGSMRLEDMGRKTIGNQVLYTMRLYSTGQSSKGQESDTPATAITVGAATVSVAAGSGSSSPLTAWWPLWDPGNNGEGQGDGKAASARKEVKLGSSDAEEAAAWMEAFSVALALPVPAQQGGGAGSPPLFLVEQPKSRPSSASPPDTLDVSSQLFTRPLPSSSSLTVPSQWTTATRWMHAASVAGTSPPLLPGAASLAAVDRGSAGFGGGAAGAASARMSTAIVPSTTGWHLDRCVNGIRIFQEVTTTSLLLQLLRIPVKKGVGVVRASPSQVFDLIMSFGPDRREWDESFAHGEVVETIDGHTDVVHIGLRRVVWWAAPRDLCLLRYWKRDEHGTYLVFFKSVDHVKCPRRWGYVRATVFSGGYVISQLDTPHEAGVRPVGLPPESLVEVALEADARAWMLHSLFSYPSLFRDSLLLVIAGLREYCAAQCGTWTLHQSATTHHSLTSAIAAAAGIHSQRVTFAPQAPEDSRAVHSKPSPEAISSADRPLSLRRAVTSFLDADAQEEFFECAIDGLSETSFESHATAEANLLQLEAFLNHFDTPKQQADATTATPPDVEASLSLPLIPDWSKFRGSVQAARSSRDKNVWTNPEYGNFRLRSRTFLTDGSMVPASEPVLQLVAVDWLRSDKQVVEHVASHPRSVVQRVKTQYGDQSPFFFCINMQVPAGKTFYSMMFYFAIDRAALPSTPLYAFVTRDDAYRNARLCMMPLVPEGSWIVKQAVGSPVVLMGQVMELKHHVTEDYIEVDVNTASSSVVRGIMGLVIGYISLLVVDMAFFIKGETEEELPDQLLGAVRCSQLELSSAVPFPFK